MYVTIEMLKHYDYLLILTTMRSNVITSGNGCLFVGFVVVDEAVGRTVVRRNGRIVL